MASLDVAARSDGLLGEILIDGAIGLGRDLLPDGDEAFAAGMLSVLGPDPVVREPALAQLPVNEEARGS